MSIPPILIRNHLHPTPGARPLLLVRGDLVHVPHPALLDLMGAFVDDLHGGWIAAARSESGFGYISGEGEWVVAPTLQDARSFTEDGLARFRADDRWGYRDLRGAVAIAPRFDDAAVFRHGLAAVKDGAQWRYIDPKGEPAFDGTFVQAGEFGNVGLALARATRLGKFGFIDRAGNWAIAPRFRRAAAFADFALAPASVDEERFGLIDASGQWAVPPTYGLIGQFNAEGYAYCRPLAWHRGVPGGYLDSAGREVIPFQEDLADCMEAGLARVGCHRYAGVQGALATSIPLAWGADFTSDGFTVARARIGREGDPRAFDEPWGILRADGRFHPVPDGVLEPLTDSERDIVLPEPGTALAAFATQDGNVALLDRNGTVVYRLERETDATLERVVLRDAQGCALWAGEPCTAARIAPFFDPRPNELLEGLQDCAQIAGLARSLLAETRCKLAALAAGEPVPARTGDDANAPDGWPDEDDEASNREDFDGDPPGPAAQVRTSRRVFRAFGDESTWFRYEFLVDQRCQAMERVHAEMLAVLTREFGAASQNPDYAGRPAEDGTSAWAIGEEAERLWLGLRASLHTGDGTFWCHVWLHCAPGSATLQRALEALPVPCPTPGR
ncbi:hypothetical protein GJV26_26685 [Massilia dura]|uniref:WG repeat-containing protein n=1 Tax=Pseudoduganella dura TaxID=321982 RepID=A0A6I3XQE2_9BURK|nr:WG repeat-containing protein [Pseudoduganella dura]MUI16021.1 hypothetical protein [Pseudoduganella dura]GGY16038.1 hypothetical protein GCM10007386_52380 [Pseudoduganella dura]